MELVMKWLTVMLIALLLLFVIVYLFRRKRRSPHPTMVSSTTEAEAEAEAEVEAEAEAEVEAEEAATNEEEQITSVLVSKQIINHCIRFFATQPKLYHQAQWDVAVAVFPPTRKRGWWTYVTVGLHMELQGELIFYSYKEEEEIIEHLIQLAKDCRKGVMLTPGQSLRLTKPIISGSTLSSALITAPLFESDGFEYYTNGTDVVRMLMLHPIADTEAEFLNTYGFPALEELFIKQEVDSLDFYRRSATEK